MPIKGTQEKIVILNGTALGLSGVQRIPAHEKRLLLPASHCRLHFPGDKVPLALER